MIMYCRCAVRNGICVVSIVMFCSCSSSKRIEHKGVLKFHPLRLACLLDAFDLSFRQRIGVVQNPADQRRLPMIDMANENDFERCAFVVSQETLSRAVSASRCVRDDPARGRRARVVRVSSSSAMISSIVLALLSTGFVIGLQPNERKRLPSRAKYIFGMGMFSRWM